MYILESVTGVQSWGSLLCVGWLLVLHGKFAYAIHLGDIMSGCLMPSLLDSFLWNLILVHLYVGSFGQYLQMRKVSLSSIVLNHETEITG